MVVFLNLPQITRQQTHSQRAAVPVREAFVSPERRRRLRAEGARYLLRSQVQMAS